MADRWRQVAALVGVKPLTDDERAVCPAAVVTADDVAFDVAEVLIAFVELLEAQVKRRQRG